MPSKELNLTLKSAHLKGFKSIEDLQIDFEKGLNILIGKNASGKSNFLECLFQSMGQRAISKAKYSKLEFVSSDNTSFIWESEKTIQNQNVEDENILGRHRIKERLFMNGELLFDSSSNEKKSKKIEYKGKTIQLIGNVRMILRNLGFHWLRFLYIKFNIPNHLTCIDSPGTLKIHYNESEFDSFLNMNTLYFLEELFLNVEIFYGGEVDKIKNLNKTTFLKRLKIKKNITDNLKKYTPIQDVRFNENINIYKDEKSVIIENIKIDFKLNNNWIPWSQLSDGTKRLFYMITEISSHHGGFILVEEPELGIHPHQLNLIMEFLKEESENKQIIISTHSPQALNHLNEDELSHILITYYDTKKNTQIKHLTNVEIKKAKKYMKEVGFFSDYWMLSDLE